MANRKIVKLTTRGRHAVMALAEIARNPNTGPMPLSQIGQRRDISLSYLEQLFAGLRRSGLVQSFRGPGGGYILSKPAADISIASILISAEDCVPARRNKSETADEIPMGDNPQTDALWRMVGEILFAVLESVSLADVIADNLTDHPQINKLFETLGEMPLYQGHEQPQTPVSRL